MGMRNTSLAISLSAPTSKCEVNSDMSYQNTKNYIQNIVNYLLLPSLLNDLFVLTDQKQGLLKP